MVRYGDNLIEEIKANTNIVNIVAQYVMLKRQGKSYFGLCPFHNEKSPSFSVSESRQIFHCFGCGVGGDAIGFLMKIENIDFKEAIEILAEKAHIALPHTEVSQDEQRRINLREKVFEINKLAAEYYHNNLYGTNAKIAQDYVKKRRMDNATLQKFQIGFSGKYDDLYQELKRQGFEDKEIFESKLVLKKEGRISDAFQSRLMFPIKDVKDRVIAFGGRTLDDTRPKSENPKYINSFETMCYSKARNLYALNVAKKTQKDYFIMVEGYMDAVSLHQRGIDNAVASLGTALTEQQGWLLKRYEKQKPKIIIGYDTDGAGQAATMRGLDILQNLGFDIRVLQLEGAKDPDEFIVKYGSAKFELYIKNAISLVEFKVKKLKETLDLNQANDKIRFLNEVSKILMKTKSEFEKEVYIDKISETYGVSKEAIYGEIRKLMNIGSKVNDTFDKPYINPIMNNNTKTNDVELGIAKEHSLIALLINVGRSVYIKIKDDIHPEDFLDKKNKQIIKILYEEFEKGEASNIIGLFSKEDELMSHITYILSKEMDIDNIDKAIEDIRDKFMEDRLKNEQLEIIKKIGTSSIDKDEEKFMKDRLNEIRDKLKVIKNRKLVNFK